MPQSCGRSRTCALNVDIIVELRGRGGVKTDHAFVLRGLPATPWGRYLGGRRLKRSGEPLPIVPPIRLDERAGVGARMFAVDNAGPDEQPRGPQRWTINPAARTVEMRTIGPAPQALPVIDGRRIACYKATGPCCRADRERVVGRPITG